MTTEEVAQCTAAVSAQTADPDFAVAICLPSVLLRALLLYFRGFQGWAFSLQTVNSEDRSGSKESNLRASDSLCLQSSFLKEKIAASVSPSAG